MDICNNNLEKTHFIYKLWIITNSENDSIKWNDNGDLLIINTKYLNLYLRNDLKSIFTCTTLTTFLLNLQKCGFKELIEEHSKLDNGKNCDLSESEINPNNAILFDFIYVKNLYFQKGRFDLLKEIFKLSSEEIENEVTENETAPLKIIAEHDEIDPTHRIIKKIKNKTIRHLLLNVTLKKERCISILQKHNCPYNNSVLITIPSDLFKCSSESITGFEEKIEYAGFYGKSLEFCELQNMFGSYLPVYLQNEDNTETDVNKIYDNSHISDYKNVDGELNSNISDTFIGFNNTPDNEKILPTFLQADFVKVTPLEPIFNQDTDADTADISMEDYIKFNKSNSNDNSAINNDQINPNDSKQVNENCIKIEESNGENELEDYSFKSFFNQYSNSMNVLLEQ